MCVCVCVCVCVCLSYRPTLPVPFKHVRSVVAVGGRSSYWNAGLHAVSAAQMRFDVAVRAATSYCMDASQMVAKSQPVFACGVHRCCWYWRPTAHVAHGAHARSDDEVQGVVSYVPTAQLSQPVHSRSLVAVQACVSVCPTVGQMLHGSHTRSEDVVGGCSSHSPGAQRSEGWHWRSLVVVGAVRSNSPPAQVCTALQTPPSAGLNVAPAMQDTHVRSLTLDPGNETWVPASHTEKGTHGSCPALGWKNPDLQAAHWRSVVTVAGTRSSEPARSTGRAVGMC